MGPAASGAGRSDGVGWARGTVPLDVHGTAVEVGAVRWSPRPARVTRHPPFAPRKAGSRATATAAATCKQPPASSPAAAPGVHPSALLDAACAACCTILLASSAARRLAQAREAHAAHNTPAERTGSTTRAASGQLQPLPPSASLQRALLPCEPCAQSQAGLIPGRLLVGPGGPLAEATAVLCCLLCALSNLSYKLSSARLTGRMHHADSANGPLTSEGAARLAGLEAVAAAQGQRAAEAARQADKLQVRTRVTSGDLRRPIAQLQAARAEHAALLSRLAGEAEALRAGLRDTQELLGALQGLSGRQFQVTVEAIKELRARQAAATEAPAEGAAAVASGTGMAAGTVTVAAGTGVA